MYPERARCAAGRTRRCQGKRPCLVHANSKPCDGRHKSKETRVMDKASDHAWFRFAHRKTNDRLRRADRLEQAWTLMADAAVSCDAYSLRVSFVALLSSSQPYLELYRYSNGQPTILRSFRGHACVMTGAQAQIIIERLSREQQTCTLSLLMIYRQTLARPAEKQRSNTTHKAQREASVSHP